jgi:hypothetical protein
VRSGHDTDPSIPRAHIHREILDAAADAPDASLDAIADEVPSARAHLVYRVRPESGEPAGAPVEPPPTDPPATVTRDSNADPETRTLSEAQERLLQLIGDDPTATQQELGEKTGVSQSTVHTRLAAIDGFEWSDRTSFVDSSLETTTTDSGPTAEADGGANAEGDDEPTADDVDESTPVADDEPKPAEVGPTHSAEQGRSATGSTDGPPEPDVSLATLDDRLTELEERVDATADGSGAGLRDPDLRYTVARACFDAESITEAEERRLFRTILD